MKDNRRTDLPLLLSFVLAGLYAVWLLLSVHTFLPAEGFSVHSRRSADLTAVMTGRDDYEKRALLPGEQIDLNEASAQELQRLPGIGPSLSAAIIEFREENGPFQETDDLMQVPGIGPGKFDAVREYLTVSQ